MNQKELTLSVVVPVYRAENTLEELVTRLIDSKHPDFRRLEIILVDDRSQDASWKKIEALSKSHNEIIGIRLSRNFGQHHAITAGLDNCTGDWVVVMDCDLQDRPEEIGRLYEASAGRYDIVLAKRSNRQDKLFKRLQSKMFYLVYSYLSGVKHDGSIANFGIYSRRCIEEFRKMREPMRAFPPMIQWMGFEKKAIDVLHSARQDGKSTYTISKLIRLALDISIAYSDKPLRLCINFGLLMSLGAFVFTIVVLFRYLSGGIEVEGYTSLIISIWFLSGIILLFLGISGLYISRIFDGIKNRPLYIIDRKING